MAPSHRRARRIDLLKKCCPALFQRGESGACRDSSSPHQALAGRDARRVIHAPRRQGVFRRPVEAALFAALAFAACGGAWALTSDRTQAINVAADHQEASLGASGKVTLTGHVTITQGSLAIHGDKAVGYENADSQWDHAVTTGAPATFSQKLDTGGSVNGSADSIEYLVAANTVVLTGHATVVQPGRGEFHGAKLTYDTDSGSIVGEGGAGGQVHMTFQPKAPPAKPAAASAPASSPQSH